MFHMISNLIFWIFKMPKLITLTFYVKPLHGCPLTGPIRIKIWYHSKFQLKLAIFGPLIPKLCSDKSDVGENISCFLIGWESSQYLKSTNEKLGFIFPHSLIYLSTVFVSVDLMYFGSVEILSDTFFPCRSSLWLVNE